MNPATKIATSVFTIGGASATGGYAWHISQLSKLSSLIETDEEVTQLTKNSSTEDWKEAWTAYKASGNGWKLSDTSPGEAPEAFKSECLKRGEEKVKGTDNIEFQNFKKWCSRNYTVSEWLSKSGLSLLNEQSSSEKWNSAWEKYRDELKKKTSNNAIPETDSIWTVKDWSDNKDKNTASNGFKEKCSEKSKLKIKNREDVTYAQVSSWCT
ncbi:hypothetical protein HF1_09300 [Mycoplasma haemofelis str. Langford 1]|uniref:Uncharacterized protein n=1 Tax=Mycoplasma haemofelis (strain Langford 1) TaxID=941640 RepID=E8ZIG7_MYCHL|nr:hypothetical protein [Mycoplasma haemofelis]CBY92938.1 hypothetical protein HF1_09300 [Mycoplasma haemofelis str. Langford 1]